MIAAHRSIQSLADAVNAWTRQRGLRPANGQTAAELSVRTLRYYRSNGMLDAPETGGGDGYGERHFLQLASIRVLQAQGLPLSRIQQLLFGRSTKDLKRIAESAQIPEPQPESDLASETWTTHPVDERIFLVAREGARISPSQLQAIREILNPVPQARN